MTVQLTVKLVGFGGHALPSVDLTKLSSTYNNRFWLLEFHTVSVLKNYNVYFSLILKRIINVRHMIYRTLMVRFRIRLIMSYM